MTKEEVKLKLNSSVTTEEAIEIFNWYIHNEAGEMYATWEQIPGREFKLSEQTVETCNSPVAKKMLEYSMIKIQEELGLINKSQLNVQMYLMGFRA